jgi:hypothetical protein
VPLKQVLMLHVCGLLFIGILIKRVMFGSDGWQTDLFVIRVYIHTRATSVLFLEVHHLLEIWTGMSDRKRIVFNALNL